MLSIGEHLLAKKMGTDEIPKKKKKGKKK